MEFKEYGPNGYTPEIAIGRPKPPISTICIGGTPGIQIGVDKKFNWFQKKMIAWCFGFEVREHK